jgi:hypothetical protein
MYQCKPYCNQQKHYANYVYDTETIKIPLFLLQINCNYFPITSIKAEPTHISSGKLRKFHML